MNPRTPADCLSHIVKAKLTDKEYEVAIARIEQLVAAECAIAQHEMHEAQLRQAGRLLSS